MMMKKNKTIHFKIKYKKLVYILDADSVKKDWKLFFK